MCFKLDLKSSSESIRRRLSGRSFHRIVNDTTSTSVVIASELSGEIISLRIIRIYRIQSHLDVLYNVNNSVL